MSIMAPMENVILLVAHSPLASALRAGALHVWPDTASRVAAVDVAPTDAPEMTLAAIQQASQAFTQDQGVLVLTDIFGATPSNMAERALEPGRMRMLTGVNLPMLLRALCYRNESLETMAEKALTGAIQGVMAVGQAAPQNQLGRVISDQRHHHHQQ